MEAKNTDLMSETVKKYLAGEISYKEGMKIIYPIYKESVEELERRLANGEKIKLEIPSRETERVRRKND